MCTAMQRPLMGDSRFRVLGGLAFDVSGLRVGNEGMETKMETIVLLGLMYGLL